MTTDEEADLAAVLNLLCLRVATDSRNWSKDNTDALIYAIAVGSNDEDGTPDPAHLRAVGERWGWREQTVAVIERGNEVIQRLLADRHERIVSERTRLG